MTNLELTIINGVHVVTPRKNLAGGEETKELVAAVAGIAAAQPSPHVVLDLGRISWASSLGLESLMRVKRTCVEHGGWLRLARVEKRIHDAMLAVRFERMFDSFDTVEEAVSVQETKAHS
jgi:anti-anti-sigma factor